MLFSPGDGLHLFNPNIPEVPIDLLHIGKLNPSVCCFCCSLGEEFKITPKDSMIIVCGSTVKCPISHHSVIAWLIVSPLQ